MSVHLSRLLEPARRNAEYFEGRRWMFAIAAIAFFPLFYFVWHDLLPQPYENLPLRLFGSLLFVPILIDHYRPARNRAAMMGYYYFVLFCALPVFFMFMLFKNNGAEAWYGSALVALFIMIRLLDWVLLIVFSVLGTALAWAFYALTTTHPHVESVNPEYLPIVAFVLVVGAVTPQERGLVHWDAAHDIEFRGSELLVVHILFNLFKNALRYIARARKGEIFIHLEASPSGGKLIFRDTGSGIPPEVLPHIFTRFNSSSVFDVLGSGIGLAFCQDAMRAIGGSIKCSSVEGQYTEFVLTFPRPTP